jgi:DNA-binding LacI/PurR family transcriptional regulator
MGFDDIPAASLTSPPLTTLMQDLKAGGDLLVETLIAQIEGRDPPAPTIPARLVVRRSTAG